MSLTKIADGVGFQYRRCLEQPLLIMVFLAAICAVAAWQVQEFRFDASADTMIAQNDPDLAFFYEVSDRFRQRPFLVLTYKADSGDLFTPTHLQAIEQLASALKNVHGIVAVNSLLDAPLLRSPPMPLSELSESLRTLRSKDVNVALARNELTASPLFKELLVSADGASTAIQLVLEQDPALDAAREARDRQRNDPNADDTVIAEAERRYQLLSARAAKREAGTIAAVRIVRDSYAGDATLYLGGVPMVRADMIAFVKADMLAFAGVIVLLLAAVLYAFFRRLRWVFIPLCSTAVALLITLGALAALGQPATAVSSSLVALVSIVTISFCIHLITRYRELFAEPGDIKQCDLAYATMRSKLAPCVYTGATTAVAFASLSTSGIIPVVDFGWMMVLGIAVSLAVTYSFFASVLVLLPKNESCESVTATPAITVFFAKLSTQYRSWVLGASVVVLVGAVIGLQQLNLGNRVVEYFRADTEIRQGLDFIDRELGGTVPIDIVVSFPPFEEAVQDDHFDDFGDEFADESSNLFSQRYWFTPEKIAQLDQLQRYLDARPELGKSVSVASLERVARAFVGDRPLTYLELTAALGSMPEAIRESLINPYASPAAGQLRISSRLHETGPNYDLDGLINDIRAYAVEDVGIAEDAIRITGIGVLFNSMLELLLKSQLSTLAFVIGATFVMFALLLRSVSMALLGLLPNIMAAMTILAFMGYAGVPLDLMTITIAAIVIGIGVDDAIHYLHRFREEIDAGKDASQAVLATHGSIGKALYFTTLVVVIGFSVLLFSRFVPTIFFGWLTALAMVLALIANLVVLPALLVTFYSHKEARP